MSICRLNSEVAGRVVNEIRKEGMGIRTGFADLDMQLCGLQKGNLYVLGGRPAMGKTTFAINIVYNIALIQNKNVLYVSYENSLQRLASKFIHLGSGIDVNTIRKGSYAETDNTKVKQMISKLDLCKLLIDGSSDMTIEQLGEKLQEKELNDLDLIVIDYLQLMTSEKSFQSRQEEVANICIELKKLARKINIPILVLSQLSRAVEQRPDHRPFMSDLRDSGAIEQYADIVILLYREDYYYSDTDMNGMMEVIIVKNKMGELATIDFLYEHEQIKFYEKSKQ